MSTIRRFSPGDAGDYRWEDVDRLAYKAEGSAPFKDVTRHVLFSQSDQACELRYFEVARAADHDCHRDACGSPVVTTGSSARQRVNYESTGVGAWSENSVISSRPSAAVATRSPVPRLAT